MAPSLVWCWWCKLKQCDTGHDRSMVFDCACMPCCLFALYPTFVCAHRNYLLLLSSSSWSRSLLNWPLFVVDTFSRTSIVHIHLMYALHASDGIWIQPELSPLASLTAELTGRSWRPLSESISRPLRSKPPSDDLAGRSYCLGQPADDHPGQPYGLINLPTNFQVTLHSRTTS